MSHPRRFAALAVAGAFILTACSSSSSSGAETITVYSGQHEQTTQQLVKDFTARTGIKVLLKSDDEASLAGQLL
jgi:iron(III) transport system substrate-binding protein